MDTFWALFAVWLLTLAGYAVARHEAEACRDNADFWRRIAIRAFKSNLAALKLMREWNPHGRLLDATVWVRKYEASRWEEAVVVAVSHKGAVAVRRVGETHTFWEEPKLYYNELACRKRSASELLFCMMRAMIANSGHSGVNHAVNRHKEDENV